MFGLSIVLFFILLAILAPWLAPYDPLATSWGAIRKAPTLAHLFGTDDIGRDVLSRVVQATLAIAAAVIAEASLSFLGLGQQPPSPSWGSMLNVAKNYVDQAPWMAIWPGLSIFLLVLSFNLLGDGLRDALDPRHN